MPITMIDKSGEPRSKEDINEAIDAVMLEIVKGVPSSIFIVYPIILDGLRELLERRRERAKQH